MPYKDKAKQKANHARWSAKNRGRQKTNTFRWRLKQWYGLTEGQYAQIIKDQDGKCAICDSNLLLSTFNTHLDHDHNTGVIRGILCQACNLGLGYFKDSPDLLHTAVAYLRRVREKPQRVLFQGNRPDSQRKTTSGAVPSQRRLF